MAHEALVWLAAKRTTSCRRYVVLAKIQSDSRQATLLVNWDSDSGFVSVIVPMNTDAPLVHNSGQPQQSDFQTVLDRSETALTFRVRSPNSETIGTSSLTISRFGIANHLTGMKDRLN